MERQVKKKAKVGRPRKVGRPKKAWKLDKAVMGRAREWQARHPWVLNVSEDEKRAETLLNAAKAMVYLCHAIEDQVKVVIHDCTFMGGGGTGVALTVNEVKGKK